MKKESKYENWIAWMASIAFGLSIVSILIWVSKHESITWTLLDSTVALLSLLVAIIAVLFGFNMFGLKRELSEYVNQRTADLEAEIQSHRLKSEFYIEKKILHLAICEDNEEDMKQSIYSMLDIVNITKVKEDIDFLVQKIDGTLGKSDLLKDRLFIEKLKIKLKKIAPISCDAEIILKHLE